MSNGPTSYRRGSVFGALLLISIGGLFLYANLEPGFRVWPLLAHWWPVLIIFWGASKLVDYLILRGRPEAAAATRLRGGEIFGLILLLLFGTAFTQSYQRSGWIANEIILDEDAEDFLRFFSNRYEFPVELIEKVEPRATLNLRGRGDITVSTIEGNELRLIARRIVYAGSEDDARETAERFEPVLEEVSDGYEFRWRTHGGSLRSLRYDLQLFIPATMSLTISNRRGDVQVKNLQADLEATLRNGNLKVEDLRGNLQATVRSGSADINHVRGNVSVEGSGGEVIIRNVTGDAVIKGSFYGPIQLAAVQGAARFKSRRTDFSVAKIDGEMTIDSGDMVVRNVPGDLTLLTRDKEIEVERIAGQILIENRNGDIVIRYQTPPRKPIDVRNRRGGIELVLPAASGFNITARSERGEVESDFSGPSLSLEEDRRGTHILKGTFGARPILITLDTSFGTIHVRRSQ